MKNQKENPSNLLIIPIEEEYGYRHWYWVYPGSREELIKDWKRGKAPLNFFDPSKGDFRGKMVLAEDWEEWYSVVEALIDISCHVHEDWDTYLQIGDEYLNHPSLTE